VAGDCGGGGLTRRCLGLRQANICYGAGTAGFYLSDLIDPPLERNAIQTLGAQAGKRSDPAFEDAEGVAKRLAADGLRSLHGGGIEHAPMAGDGLARPNRTDLAGRLIANGDHKMHHGCARLCELIPTLAAHPFSGKTQRAPQTECEGMDLAFWETAGAKAPETIATPMIDE
jgi:hypothetical protein